MWKETRKVGFGVASKNGQTFVVAAYTPRGNVVTKFTENVLPTKLMGLRKNTFRQQVNLEDIPVDIILYSSTCILLVIPVGCEMVNTEDATLMNIERIC